MAFTQIEVQFPLIFLLLHSQTNESAAKITGVVWKLPEMQIQYNQGGQKGARILSGTAQRATLSRPGTSPPLRK